MKSSKFRYALLTGIVIATAFWIFVWYFKIRHQSGWVPSIRGLWYNIPISFVFIILLCDLLFDSVKRPVLNSLTSNWPYFLVWIAGFLQLYFRLVEKSINVSGHMTWLTLLFAHSIFRSLPVTFVLFVAAVWLHAAYFNFFLFTSASSGLNGTLFGIFLSFVLFLFLRIEQQSNLGFRKLFKNNAT